jgi:hypothetical protein
VDVCENSYCNLFNTNFFTLHAQHCAPYIHAAHVSLVQIFKLWLYPINERVLCCHFISLLNHCMDWLLHHFNSNSQIRHLEVNRWITIRFDHFQKSNRRTCTFFLRFYYSPIQYIYGTFCVLDKMNFDTRSKSNRTSENVTGDGIRKEQRWMKKWGVQSIIRSRFSTISTNHKIKKTTATYHPFGTFTHHGPPS